MSQQDISEEIIIDDLQQQDESIYKEGLESLQQIQFLPSDLLKLSLQNKKIQYLPILLNALDHSYDQFQIHQFLNHNFEKKSRSKNQSDLFYSDYQLIFNNNTYYQQNGIQINQQYLQDQKINPEIQEKQKEKENQKDENNKNHVIQANQIQQQMPQNGHKKSDKYDGEISNENGATSIVNDESDENLSLSSSQEHCIYSDDDDDDTSSLYTEIDQYINLKGIPSIYETFRKEFQQPNKRVCKPSHKEEIHRILELEEQAKKEEQEKEKIIQQQEREQLEHKIEKYQKLENKKKQIQQQQWQQQIQQNGHENQDIQQEDLAEKQKVIQQQENAKREYDMQMKSLDEDELNLIRDIRNLEKLLQRNEDEEMLDVDEIKKNQKKISKENKKLDVVKNQKLQIKQNSIKILQSHFQDNDQNNNKQDSQIVTNQDQTDSEILSQTNLNEQNIYAKPNAQFYKKNNSKKPTSRQLAIKQRNDDYQQNDQVNQNGAQKNIQSSQNIESSINLNNSSNNGIKNGKKQNRGKKNKELKENNKEIEDSDQLYRHVPHDYKTDQQVFDQKIYTYDDFAKMAHLKERNQFNEGYHIGLQNMLDQIKDFPEKHKKEFVHNFTTQDDVNFFEIGPGYQSDLPKHNNCEMNAERIMNIRSLLIRKRYTSGIATQKDIETVMHYLKKWFGEKRNQEEACYILSKCNYKASQAIDYMRYHAQLLKYTYKEQDEKIRKEQQKKFTRNTKMRSQFFD